MSKKRRQPLVGRQVRLPGIPVPITIVSDEQMAEADFAICAPAEGPLYFDDDVFTTCALCDSAIRHRPYLPAKLKKLCLRCASHLGDEPS